MSVPLPLPLRSALPALLLGSLAGGAPLAAPLVAQPAAQPARLAPDTAAVDTAAPPPAAPAEGERLSVHGYLTQGWAQSSGPQFYGIGPRASTDFRYAALQARFAPTAHDHFLVQLNHRRLGRSPITDFESDVKLNWAFYARELRDGTTVKVGRIPIPRGIYNELRAVGVALPLYRPPVVLYDEGAYYSETIDGVVASRTFAAERPWSLEANAYVGGWRSLAYDTWSPTYTVSRTRSENAAGLQLWLQTPADGVRLGAAAQRHVWTVEAEEPYTQLVSELHASLDATRERWFVRAEAQLQHYPDDDFWAGYAQGGLRVGRRLQLVLESQRSRETNVAWPALDVPRAFDWHRSDAVGASWALSPALVLKAEHHWDRGIQLEQPGDPRDPPRFRYGIVSLSTSF